MSNDPPPPPPGQPPAQPPGQPPAAPPPPPPPPPGQPPGQPMPPMASPPNSSKAVTALILGILGLVVCGLLGIAAIVVGNQARREIAASGGRQGGEGLAKTGVILGWISVAFLVLGLVLLIVLAAAGAMSSN